MNFLSEVINIVNENDIADARSGLKKLRNEIGKHQNAAKDYIEANYVDFNDMVVENSQLLEQADKLSIEVDGLYEKINIETKEDIKGVANDLQSYLNEMEELRIGLRVNKRLIRIDNLFRQLELTQELNQITEVHTVLSELKECIFNHEDHDLFKQLDCYTNLKNRWQIEKEGFSTLLSAMFDTKFQTEERSFQTSKCVLLKISTDAQLQQIFYLLLQTSFNVQRLFTFLMANVFEPILTRPVSFETKTVKDGQKSMEFNTIEVSFSTKQIGSGERSLRPNYKHVFSHLTKVFNILKPINIILPNKKRFFQHMADKISGEFFDLLIGECLEHSIPERIDDLCNSDLTKDIKDFDEFLKSVNFHSESTSNKAIEFIEKIDVIFKKRFCLDIINRAVQIMQQDLHEMQIIEESNADGNFPRCMVSRSTFDLINLMEQVLKESENMTAKSVDAYVLADIKARLRQTIPLILHQYPTEILNTHGKLLQTIPQPSALFHNNCTYLAWWFSRCDIDEANADQPGSFSSDAINNELQEYGSKQFATQISNQRTQIMEILKDLDLADSIEFGPQPLKIVRQCIRQMELLKNVWQTILPELVYNKTMGVIVNHFCEEIVKKVMACEDISSETSNGLVSICETIIERLPAVFTDPLMVSVHTRNWVKLQQIKTILNASMAEIVELWADGKGPLTLNFRAEDIRHLIRAIFQNTDRRANALANIL